MPAPRPPLLLPTGSSPGNGHCRLGRYQGLSETQIGLARLRLVGFGDQLKPFRINMLATVLISVRLFFVFRSLLPLFIGMLAGCRGWVAVDVLQVICFSGVRFFRGSDNKPKTPCSLGPTANTYGYGTRPNIPETSTCETQAHHVKPRACDPATIVGRMYAW